MKKSILRAGAIALSATMLLSMAGCGNKTENADTTKTTYGDTYPLNAEKPIKWWTYIDGNITVTANNLGDTPYGKALQEQLGATIEFEHPTTGGGSEQFNLMLASGELPDIIDHYWTDFPGGPEKAIRDGYIIPLNDYIDAYAPNFKKYMEEHPELKKDIMTDEGTIYMFPYINCIPASGGLIIRQDWLDDLNMDMPETIDEWHDVLTAFKEQKGATAPLAITTSVFGNGAFTGAYNMQTGLYREGDTIKFGYYEDSYKDFLTTMNQWYNEGILDGNFSTLDSTAVTANMLNGASGVSYGGITGGIGKFNQSKADDPKYKVVAAPNPTDEKGKIPEFAQYVREVTVFGSAVSAKCEDIELAVRAIDYLYSEDGIMLNNYGVEGESYTMVDGKPVFTDTIMNNPEGLTMGQALSRYAKPYNSYNSVQVLDAYEQTLTLPEMKEAYKVWGNSNGKEHNIGVLFPTEAESARVSELGNAINTYVEEMLIKFIYGTEPLSNFESYKETLKSMGVEEYIQIKQDEYDRYKVR